jgi:sec-independent protein translocase protein TatA
MIFANVLGPDLIIVIVIAVVLLFGGAAIPKLARNLGSAKTEFEKGLKNKDADPAVTAKAEETKSPDVP